MRHAVRVTNDFGQQRGAVRALQLALITDRKRQRAGQPIFNELQLAFRLQAAE